MLSFKHNGSVKSIAIGLTFSDYKWQPNACFAKLYINSLLKRKRRGQALLLSTRFSYHLLLLFSLEIS